MTARIDQAAAQLSSAAANRDLRHLLERLIHGALDPNRPTIPFPPLGADEKLKSVGAHRGHARRKTRRQRSKESPGS